MEHAAITQQQERARLALLAIYEQADIELHNLLIQVAKTPANQVNYEQVRQTIREIYRKVQQQTQKWVTREVTNSSRKAQKDAKTQTHKGLKTTAALIAAALAFYMARGEPLGRAAMQQTIGSLPQIAGKALATTGYVPVRKAIALQINRLCSIPYENGTVVPLATYALSMASGTMMNAYNSTLVKIGQAADIPLVQWSNHATDCYECMPFEDSVWALNEEGEKLGYPPLTVAPPLHPNCWHFLTLFTVEPEGAQPPPQWAIGATRKELRDHMKKYYPEQYHASVAHHKESRSEQQIIATMKALEGTAQNYSDALKG